MRGDKEIGNPPVVNVETKPVLRTKQLRNTSPKTLPRFNIAALTVTTFQSVHLSSSLLFIATKTVYRAAHTRRAHPSTRAESAADVAVLPLQLDRELIASHMAQRTAKLAVVVLLRCTPAATFP